MKFSVGKKCVLKRRSESRQAQAARRMLKINMPRMALRNHAHTVTGIRGSDIPLARRSMVVTLTIQSVIPDGGKTKNAPVIPTNEATVAQNARRFSVGKAISHAPIWSGRK